MFTKKSDIVTLQETSVEELTNALATRFKTIEKAIDLDLGGGRSVSVAGARHSQSLPKTIFEIERDAEVQEISRLFTKLSHRVDKDLDQIRFTAEREIDRSSRKAFNSALLVAGGIAVVVGIISGLVGSMFFSSKSVPATVATLPPEMSQPPVVVPPPDAGPAVMLTDPPPAPIKAPLPEASIQTVAEQDPAVKAQTPPPPTKTVVAPISRAVVTPPAPVQAVPAKAPAISAPVKPAAAKPDKGEDNSDLFAIAGDQSKAGNGTAPKAPASNKPTVATPALVSQTPAASVRSQKVKYGENGILTLLPGAVVVFDKARNSQVMVRVGQKLPDGAEVRAVDPGNGTITTDRAELRME